MRRWASIPSASAEVGAAPDDQEIWSDVSEVWPTRLGSYAVCDQYYAQTTHSLGSTFVYVWAGLTPSGSVGYRFATGPVNIVEIDNGIDRTGTATLSGSPYAAQFGDVTIVVSGVTTIGATGGNFSQLAAPRGNVSGGGIVLSESGAVLILNGNDTTSYPDGWWASDIGDYTNWSTGEAANGRLLQTPGPITGAVAFRGSVYAFKADAIYRGTYVGGDVKWAWEVVVRGVGAVQKYGVVVCNEGIAFVSAAASGAQSARVMFFDGANPPVLLNPDVHLVTPTYLTYDAQEDLLVATHGTQAQPQYFYRFASRKWGRGTAPTATGAVYPVMGDGAARRANTGQTSARPMIFGITALATLTRFNTVVPESATTTVGAYVETGLMGEPDKKTTFTRLIPLLRRRVNRSGGTSSVSCAVTTYTERHGGTATGPTTVSEATNRHRFDLLGSGSTSGVTNTFAKFKLTFTDIAADIDDVRVHVASAGTD